MIVCYWIPKSKFGLALFSIREDEEVAAAFGIHVNRNKMAAYVLSSIFPALLGGTYAWYAAFIDPEVVFGTDKALLPVTMVMLGGTGTFLGPIMGGVFMMIIEEFLWTSMWLPVWIKSLAPDDARPYSGGRRNFFSGRTRDTLPLRKVFHLGWTGSVLGRLSQVAEAGWHIVSTSAIPA